MDNKAHSKVINVNNRMVCQLTLAMIFVIFVIATIYTIAHNNIVQKREVEKYSEIKNMKSRLLSEYTKIGSDLFYFSQNELTKTVLQAPNQNNIEQLTSLIIKIASLHKSYDQIRLLDNQGNEVIRVNQNKNSKLDVVEKERLQNKSDRYYYKETAKLKHRTLYISKFDLNVENKKVEIPTKLMIRFSTPIYSENNAFIGIGIINYLGQNAINLLNTLKTHTGDILCLINSNGYYLNNKDTSKNWLSLSPNKKPITFAQKYPYIWENMLKQTEGRLTHNKDEFYYTEFQLTDFPLHNVINSEKIYIVIHVPKTTIHNGDNILIKGLFIGSVLIIPLILLLVYKLVRSKDAQEQLINKLHHQAFNDQLTGLYNRQAIFDYLKKSLLLYKRKNTIISVGYIDVNNLKEVNDQQGHEVGDDLIRGVATAINMSIRQSDFAARIGGDEFLVIFIDCDKKNAEKTMKKIQNHYHAIGKEKNREWSLCYGCSEVLDKTDNAQTMIDRADREMYTQKERIKQSTKDVAVKVHKKDLINIRTHSMNLLSKTLAVQSLDKDGYVLDVSPEWLKLTGYYREEALGKHFTEFLDKKSFQQVEKNFPRLKGYGYVNNVELAIKCHDGKIIPTLLNGTSMYDEAGAFMRTFCEITPIRNNKSSSDKKNPRPIQ